MNLIVLLSIATIWLKKIYSLPKLYKYIIFLKINLSRHGWNLKKAVLFFTLAFQYSQQTHLLAM